MSKDLIKSATIQANKADLNYIDFKGDDIGVSMRPELVHRTTLQPVVSDSGEVENRVYYTLHNDAGDCVYMSPFIYSEQVNNEIFQTIIPGQTTPPQPPLPNIPPPQPPLPDIPPVIDPPIIPGIDPPPGPPDPPPPGPIVPPIPPKPIYPPIIDEDPSGTDGPGGWWGPTGGGGVIGGGSSGGGGGGGAEYRTNFDDYAQELVDDETVASTRDVVKWYDNRSMMDTAKRAMKNTRAGVRNGHPTTLGTKINESYANLLDAEDMFYGACLDEAFVSIPKTTLAKGMFSKSFGTGSGLQEFRIRKANALEDASQMFKGSEAWIVTFADFNKKRYTLKNCEEMFADAKNVVYISLPNTKSVTNINKMFYNTNDLDITPRSIEFDGVETAKEAFSGCINTSIINKLSFTDLLTHANGMFKNCKLLEKTPQYFYHYDGEYRKFVFPAVNAPELYMNCYKLAGDRTLVYPRLTNANYLYAGCKKFTFTDALFPVATEIEGMFKDCISLDSAVINDFKSAINATSLFEGCTKLKEVYGKIITNADGEAGTSRAAEAPSESGSSANKEPFSLFESPALAFPACTNASNMFSGCKDLTNVALRFDQTNITGLNEKFFNQCSLLSEVRFEAPNATSVSGLFKNKKNLKRVAVNFDNCLNVKSTFENCPSLAYFHFVDTENGFKKATEMDSLFKDCISLKSVSLGECPAAESIDSIFAGSGVESISAEFTNLTDVNYNYILGCNKLRTIVVHFPALTDGTDLYNAKKTLALDLRYVRGNFGSLTDGTRMFANNKVLEIVGSNFPVLETAPQMCFNCTKLTNTFGCPSLKVGHEMFSNCKSLEYITPGDFDALEDGFRMFQGSSISSIPQGGFPSLKNARNLFNYANFTGHLDINMARDFPNVSKNNCQWNGILTGEFPAAYMFGSNKITSIKFDFSTLDNGISMFWGCSHLEKCTGARFKEGGEYQSMFDAAAFDVDSAKLIINAAKAAGVKSLHVGVNGVVVDTLEKREEFAKSVGAVPSLDGRYSIVLPTGGIEICWTIPGLDWSSL